MTARMKTRREIETEIAQLTDAAQKMKRAYAVSAAVARIDALNWVLGKTDPFGGDR